MLDRISRIRPWGGWIEWKLATTAKAKKNGMKNEREGKKNQEDPMEIFEENSEIDSVTGKKATKTKRRRKWGAFYFGEYVRAQPKTIALAERRKKPKRSNKQNKKDKTPLGC